MTHCDLPIFVHRANAVGGGVIEKTECPSPECDAQVDRHAKVLPCRWSHLYARGKGYNGIRFPQQVCPWCSFISRSGIPEVAIDTG